MSWTKLSMALAAAMMLLSAPGPAGNPQVQGTGQPECPGSAGAVPASAGANGAARGASPQNAGAGASPAFEDCGVGAVPQAQDDRGRGADNGQDRQ